MTNSMLPAVLGILSALVLGVVALANMNAANDWQAAAEQAQVCYEDAAELAEQSLQLTDDFADTMFNSLNSILRGGTGDNAGIERLGDEHREAKGDFEDLEDRCDPVST